MKEILIKILNSISLDTNELENITILGVDPILPSPYKIASFGAASLAAVGYAISKLWQLPYQEPQQVKISSYEAALALRSYHYLRVNQKPLSIWSEFSDFYLTKDNRWIQLHTNSQGHIESIFSLLHSQPNKKNLTEKILTWKGEELETFLAEHSLCAALVRTKKEWQNHPHAKATENLPLMEIIKIGESAQKPFSKKTYPLSDIRVLDLTRVLAGPVCGKTLAEFGATVLRVDSPYLQDVLPLSIDTGFGKLTSHIDLNTPEGKTNLITLLQKADIFSQAYHPGCMISKGFSKEALHTIRPGIIYIDFSAYSHIGPWQLRHGYDTIVQSATGLAYNEDGPPKHMPAQALDYITGFLGAFGALVALKKRALEGGSYLIRLSLLQTANFLNNLGELSNFSHSKIPTFEEIKDFLITDETPFGQVTHLRPLLHLSKTPPLLLKNSLPLGSNPPAWPL